MWLVTFFLIALIAVAFSRKLVKEKKALKETHTNKIAELTADFAKEKNTLIGTHTNEKNKLKADFAKERNKLTETHMSEIKTLKEAHTSEINELDTEYLNREKQIKKNIIKPVHKGEKILISKFIGLFKDGKNAEWNESSVYFQLTLDDKKNGDPTDCILDFLIVSPNGLFVIESKLWDGITYIYRNDCSCPIFDEVAEFKDFGKGQNEDTDQKRKTPRIFNAKTIYDKDNGENNIILKRYTNPIAQARKYSKLLSVLLKVKPVKNVIVFHVDEKRDVRIDNKNIKDIGIDSCDTEIDYYSKIITDNGLEELFESDWYTKRDSRYTETVDDVNKIIENLKDSLKLQYRFKLDITNFMTAPFTFDWIEGNITNQHCRHVDFAKVQRREF